MYEYRLNIMMVEVLRAKVSFSNIKENRHLLFSMYHAQEQGDSMMFSLCVSLAAFPINHSCLMQVLYC